METIKSRLMLVLAAALGLCYSVQSLATLCPTHFNHDQNGYWTSNEHPGWKSHRPTNANVTLDPKDFGGAVYSPQKKRIACVYKASDGNWVALLSSIYHPFNEDDLTGKGWEFSQEHKDYICGQPKSGIYDCDFKVIKQ